MFKTIIAVIVVTLVVLILMSVVDRVTGEIADPMNESSTTYSSEDSLQVSISGEIAHSGTYFLPLASTLAALLSAAGGTTSNADPKAYNTGCLLLNKASFYIAPLYDNANACQVAPIEKTNVNSADADLLKKGVDAFSSTVAAAVVEYRTSNGEFQQLEDLKKVTGIGPSTFEKCKNYVTLHE